MKQVPSYLIPTDWRRTFDAIAKRMTLNLDRKEGLSRWQVLLDADVKCDERKISDVDGFEDAGEFFVGLAVFIFHRRKERSERVQCGWRNIERLLGSGLFEIHCDVNVLS